MTVLFVSLSSSSSGCGWYGPSFDNITSPKIPLGVCGNYGVKGSTEKSIIYECDEHDSLKMKMYDEHGCDDSKNPVIATINNPHYRCDGEECHGHLVLETYSNCYDFIEGDLNGCSCGSSSVEILNTNVCIVQLDGSYVASCDAHKVTLQYYSDHLCQNGTGDLRFKFQGCIEEDAARYNINLCSGSPSSKTAINSVMFIVFASIFFVFCSVFEVEKLLFLSLSQNESKSNRSKMHILSSESNAIFVHNVL